MWNSVLLCLILAKYFALMSSSIHEFCFCIEIKWWMRLMETVHNVSKLYIRSSKMYAIYDNGDYNGMRSRQNKFHLCCTSLLCMKLAGAIRIKAQWMDEFCVGKPWQIDDVFSFSLFVSLSVRQTGDVVVGLS